MSVHVTRWAIGPVILVWLKLHVSSPLLWRYSLVFLVGVRLSSPNPISEQNKNYVIFGTIFNTWPQKFIPIFRAGF